MRRAALICLLTFSSGVAFAEHHSHGTATKLATTDGKEVGVAHFMPAKDGVAMHVKVTGMAQGTHGIHLHAVGSCQSPDFSSAGPHWNPMDKEHGIENPQGAHMGDLTNLVVNADGTGELKTTVKGARLDSGKTGMFDSDGTALVIHAAPDDYRTDPSGDSGARIACGVVTES